MGLREGSVVEVLAVGPETSGDRYFTVEEGMAAYFKTEPLHRNTYRELAKGRELERKILSSKHHSGLCEPQLRSAPPRSACDGLVRGGDHRNRQAVRDNIPYGKETSQQQPPRH